MARPARVRMRVRNPWVFARLRLLGWKVRLMVGSVRIAALAVKCTSEPTALGTGLVSLTGRD